MLYQTYKIPVSIKGIVFEEGKVWLRKNQRGEWELPGGKIDRGEQPEDTLIREISEELGLKVEVVKIIQAYLYVIDSSSDEADGVLVVSYLCDIKDRVGDFEHEGEGGRAEYQPFSLKEIEELNLQEFYKIAIKKAYEKIMPTC